MNQGSVTFHSVGPESDNLLAAVSHVYRTEPPGTAMKEVVAFAAISMDGDPATPAAGPSFPHFGASSTVSAKC